MIVFKRLDHIQICIPIGMEAQARDFYTNIMGLTEIPKPVELLKNGGLWYQLADIQLHIGVETTIHLSKRHPAFEIENLIETKAFLSSKGVTIQEDVPIPNQIRFSMIDPFGNRIEFLQKI